MEFRTPLHIKPSRFKIGYDTPGLVCGSCFAERIGQKMLDEGKVAGIGTHRELLANCRVYQEIVESQLAKEEIV